MIADQFIKLAETGKTKTWHPSVKLQFLECLVSLSQSNTQIKTLLKKSKISKLLSKWINDECYDFAVTLTLTVDGLQEEAQPTYLRHYIKICANLLMTFNPDKQVLIDSGILQFLVNLTHSSDSKIRNSSLWALMNAAYQETISNRLQIINTISWSQLEALSNDDELSVVYQMLFLLRNLVTSDTEKFSVKFMTSGGTTARSLIKYDKIAMEYHSIIFELLEHLLDSNNVEKSSPNTSMDSGRSNIMHSNLSYKNLPEVLKKW